MSGDSRRYPETSEAQYLDDNIVTVAYHLGRPGAKLAVGYDGDTKLVVYPGEVLQEISRRLTGAPAQSSGICGEIGGFMPSAEWPKEIDERVLIYVVHAQAQFEPDQAKRLAEWEGWHVGYWTDFNKGGWVWHGMSGIVTHVAPLPAGPSLSSTTRESPDHP